LRDLAPVLVVLPDFAEWRVLVRACVVDVFLCVGVAKAVAARRDAESRNARLARNESMLVPH